MSESGSRFKASIKSPATRRAESSSLRPAVVAGWYTGAMLSIVMLGAVVVANRIPALEPYAFERNAASYALFGILMAVPVFRFITRPARMFISAMIAWLLLTVAYDFAGLYFR